MQNPDWHHGGKVWTSKINLQYQPRVPAVCRNSSYSQSSQTGVGQSEVSSLCEQVIQILQQLYPCLESLHTYRNNMQQYMNFPGKRIRPLLIGIPAPHIPAAWITNDSKMAHHELICWSSGPEQWVWNLVKQMKKERRRVKRKCWRPFVNPEGGWKMFWWRFWEPQPSYADVVYVLWTSLCVYVQ